MFAMAILGSNRLIGSRTLVEEKRLHMAKLLVGVRTAAMRPRQA